MERLTIADLVERTGVPPATIHYYRRLGLLPKPRRLSANRFGYDERHVRGLQLIRTLRERRGLSLPMIKRILPDLLQLEQAEAFLPEMWDRALAPRMAARRRTPADRLRAAALEAFARRGYGEVNVDDLCRAARIAKGSFYRHFRSKEELFLTVAGMAAREVAERFRTAAAGRPMPEATAVTMLAGELEPRLPIFLDLFARTLQNKPGYHAALHRVLTDLALDLGPLVAAEDEEGTRGQRLLALAAGAVLLRAASLDAPLLPIPDAAFDTTPNPVAESDSTSATG